MVQRAKKESPTYKVPPSTKESNDMNSLELEHLNKEHTDLDRDEKTSSPVTPAAPSVAPSLPSGPYAQPDHAQSTLQTTTPQTQPIQAIPTRQPETVDTRSSADQVRSKLVAALDEGRALTLVETAKMFGIRPRTLQERLQNENVTFQSLMQDARAELARKLLAGSQSIPAVAEALAYADPRAFRRAFKRWTGVTPGVYRKRLRQERADRDNLVDTKLV